MKASGHSLANFLIARDIVPNPAKSEPCVKGLAPRTLGLVCESVTFFGLAADFLAAGFELATMF